MCYSSHHVSSSSSSSGPTRRVRRRRASIPRPTDPVEREVGCIALRPLTNDTAELKRLWVRPEARGTGAGRLLVGEAIQQARLVGYARVQLDTTPGMEAAQALYTSFGFIGIPPYRPNPVPGATYLELILR